MSTAPLVVLDTNLVRSFAHGDPRARRFAELGHWRDHARFVVSDVTLWELINALYAGAPTFEEWGRAASTMESIIDRESPVRRQAPELEQVAAALSPGGPDEESLAPPPAPDLANVGPGAVRKRSR